MNMTLMYLFVAMLIKWTAFVPCHSFRLGFHVVVTVNWTERNRERNWMDCSLTPPFNSRKWSSVSALFSVHVKPSTTNIMKKSFPLEFNYHFVLIPCTLSMDGVTLIVLKSSSTGTRRNWLNAVCFNLILNVLKILRGL